MIDDDGKLPIEACAHRMGTTVEHVRHLVARGVLAATRDGLYVQPAIVTGAVDG